MATSYDLIEMPDGSGEQRCLLAVAIDGSLAELLFCASEKAALAAAPEGAPRDGTAAPLPQVRRELAEYFAGHRRAFALPLAPRGRTFQRSVWDALLEIPFGETRSYAQIAAAIGRPDACRAVGHANGSNPIPIVIPCHRVIGSDGSLTGYGGGLALKRYLLALEGVLPDGTARPRPQMALPFGAGGGPSPTIQSPRPGR